MSKQDRNGVRTAQDLERKYDFAELELVKKNVRQQAEGINKTNATLEEFMRASLESIEGLKTQIDGNITSYFYSGVPTMENPPVSDWDESEYENHLGDLYYDKDTGVGYRFIMVNDEYRWDLASQDVAEVLAIANAAKDTADSKRRVFVATPVPPYDNGDLWLNNQEIYVCQISKSKEEEYVEKDFIPATKYTDDTLAKQVGDNLEIVRGTVTTIQEGVDSFKIDIETQVKSVNDLQQETLESMERMSYTFGTKDLTIANSNDPVNTSISNQGLKVFNYRTLQALFNHRGSGVQKLIVVGDTQLANLSIVKTKDEDGNDCTDFNHLVSNIQSLKDLEG